MTVSPADLVAHVLAEAQRYLKVREVPVGSNRSTAIDYWLAEAGVPLGLPWCASFFGQVGRQAIGAAWPCPRTASVAALAEWAQRDARVWQETPEAGDGFVIWHQDLKRYAHVGFVLNTLPGGFRTVEGNANPAGGREGYGVFSLTRTVGLDTKFVRWVALFAP